MIIRIGYPSNSEMANENDFRSLAVVRPTGDPISLRCYSRRVGNQVHVLVTPEKTCF